MSGYAFLLSVVFGGHIAVVGIGFFDIIVRYPGKKSRFELSRGRVPTLHAVNISKIGASHRKRDGNYFYLCSGQYSP